MFPSRCPAIRLGSRQQYLISRQILVSKQLLVMRSLKAIDSTSTGHA
jgi:hypothetical protein